MNTAYEIEAALKVVTVEMKQDNGRSPDQKINLENPGDTWKQLELKVAPEQSSSRP